MDAAHVAAAQVGGDTATSLLASADQAFVTAMGSTTDIAAAVALGGALLALLFLPSRGKRADAVVVEADLELDQVEPGCRSRSGRARPGVSDGWAGHAPGPAISSLLPTFRPH